MSKIIYGPEEELEYLESLKSDEFNDWLQNFLKTGISAPLHISSKYSEETRAQAIIEYFKASRKNEFNDGVVKSVNIQLGSWHAEDEESHGYLFDLLELAMYLVKINPAYISEKNLSVIKGMQESEDLRQHEVRGFPKGTLNNSANLVLYYHSKKPK